MRGRVALGAVLLWGLAAAEPTNPNRQLLPPAPWDSIRAAPMRGDLAIFWNIGGNDSLNSSRSSRAVQHGFKIVDMLGTFADYPGNQREAIDGPALVSTNPWKKPPFFERIVRRNIAGAGGHDLFVHDIEFPCEEDAEKAWADKEARALSGTQTKEAFRAAYLREWASWFSLPCRWTKERYPREPVGIYGAQPFRNDYWGIAGKNEQQIADTHRTDAEMWKYIDPYVDFYVASIYCFYDDPGSIYYMAVNLEENYRRSLVYGHKPIYAYIWLRYHESNRELAGQELAPYLVEAAAVLPFFEGAKGLALWGFERDETEQPYRCLPRFMNSLGRISDLSTRIAKARPVMDEPAHVLWNEKRPLQRKLKISNDEWIILAVNPWQGDRDRTQLTVSCDNRKLRLSLEGRHTDLFHVRGDQVERLRVSD